MMHSDIMHQVILLDEGLVAVIDLFTHLDPHVGLHMPRTAGIWFCGALS